MKTTLFSLAAGLLLASSVHATSPVPAANSYKSNLTFPTPPSGADFKITKASTVQLKASTNTITFQLVLAGVVDTANANAPVSQTGNTFQVDLRYEGVVKTVQFNFNLINGKIDPTTKKFPVTISGGFPAPGIVSGDSVEVVRVRCLQGGSGPGAGNNFCVAGLTAK